MLFEDLGHSEDILLNKLGVEITNKAEMPFLSAYLVVLKDDVKNMNTNDPLLCSEWDCQRRQLERCKVSRNGEIELILDRAQ